MNQEIQLNVRDAARAVQGRVLIEQADRLLAALSADPETIEELDAALIRFEAPDPAGSWLRQLTEGTDERLWNGGLVVIDLAARLVVLRSRHGSLMQRGQEQYYAGHAATVPEPSSSGSALSDGTEFEGDSTRVDDADFDDDSDFDDGVAFDDDSEFGSSSWIAGKAEEDDELWLPFHLAADWQLISGDIEGWDELAAVRRERRQSHWPLDARTVMYGRLAEDLAAACLAARRGLGESSKDADPSSEIHIQWLMTPRDDLRGRTPREIFLAQREHLDFDLQDRAASWSRLGACPPGISRQSHAFRFGGFGTHEWVVHYELVRNLLQTCWERLANLSESGLTEFSLGDEVARLRQVQDDWLHSPSCDYEGMVPEQVIIHERCRLPVAMGGQHAMVDDDCPVCRMMSEGNFGPMFWHLDGCNMDDHFAFSDHETLEEFERECRDREEFNRRFNAEHADELAEWKTKKDASIWKTSYFDPYALTGVPGPGIWIMGLATHLSELSLDLKSAGRSDLKVELNEAFDNLHEAFQHQPELHAATSERFANCLFEIARACPALSEKCTDMENELGQFNESFEDWLANPPRGWRDGGSDDAPF